MTIQEGRRTIAQAVTDCWVKERGPGHPHVNLPAQTTLPVWSPKRFPSEGCVWGWWFWLSTITSLASRGWECNRHWRDQRPPSPQFPSPSLDCGFKSDQSSLSMASMMLSRSDRLDGSQHPRRGRWHWEDGTPMKINLPVFKDKDAKDEVTYQSWRWDLTVYQCAGCRDCTLLPYAI